MHDTGKIIVQMGVIKLINSNNVLNVVLYCIYFLNQVNQCGIDFLLIFSIIICIYLM